MLSFNYIQWKWVPQTDNLNLLKVDVVHRLGDKKMRQKFDGFFALNLINHKLSLSFILSAPLSLLSFSFSFPTLSLLSFSLPLPLFGCPCQKSSRSLSISRQKSKKTKRKLQSNRFFSIFVSSHAYNMHILSLTHITNVGWATNMFVNLSL